MKVTELFESPSALAPYANNIKAGNVFFRGLFRDITTEKFKVGDEQYLIFKPFKRTSLANSTMFEFTKDWDVPPRNNCVIATSKFPYARKFAGGSGVTYLIIPRDDVKSFAYCDSDFNISKTNKVRRDYGDFFFSFSEIASNISGRKRESGKTPAHYKEIVHLLNTEDPTGYTYQGKPLHPDRVKELMKRIKLMKDNLPGDAKTVQEAFAKFKPENVGVSVYSQIKDIPNIMGDEVWFSGDCLAVAVANGGTDARTKLKELRAAIK